MKFSQFEYKRPDMEQTGKHFDELLNEFENAEDIDKQCGTLNKINDLRTEFESMGNIASIKYSIDTNNRELEEEQSFFDNNYPVYEGYLQRYYKALTDSIYRKELEEKLGKYLFQRAEIKLKTFKPELIEDLKQENQLSTEYSKLIASAKIMFNDKETNLQNLYPYMESTDREIRKKAFTAYWNFYAENTQRIDEIFDRLVKLRHGMALKLGYKNFVEVGYARMQRTDYDPAMVANFRKQVKEIIVPITQKLRERQRERLGLDSLKAYDNTIQYNTGNATPKGEPQWIVDNAKTMYNELSPETNEFFNFMVDNELMDLYSREGKENSGYCSYIHKYKSPFIFANMNGTDGDIDVLTHEAGHALQKYLSRNFKVKEYIHSTAETAEIHSMSMEFLTWPWMKLFFKEDTEKYKFTHLQGSLMLLPSGVTIDEFQHFIYENPDATPTERKTKWRELQKKYSPTLDYDGNEFLESGGRWQSVPHIFHTPFYYIDYCLAQICAFQFWKKANANREKAMQEYMDLCKTGGSRSFVGAVKVANLCSPFEDGCVKSIAGDISDWLDSVDDMKL